MKLIVFLLLFSNIVKAQVDTLSPNLTFKRVIDFRKIEQYEFFRQTADSLDKNGSDYESDHGREHTPLRDERFNPIINLMVNNSNLDIYSINDVSDPFSSGKIDVSYFRESSFLLSNKNIFYNSNKAFDGDLSTAWIENNSDYGIGEYIKCATRSESLSGVMIYNGYFKSDELWATNSRVKLLKIYFNNIPKYVLRLNDKMEIQYFFFPKYKLNQRSTEILEIKMEILDVYAGERYKDTALSEIIFLK